MSHLPSCTTRKELTGNVWVHYSNPDPDCNDKSHHDAYTEENQ
jgi:hypothetical protein